jgi:hypothetical protein
VLAPQPEPEREESEDPVDRVPLLVAEERHEQLVNLGGPPRILPRAALQYDPQVQEAKGRLERPLRREAQGVPVERHERVVRDDAPEAAQHPEPHRTVRLLDEVREEDAGGAFRGEAADRPRHLTADLVPQAGIRERLLEEREPRLAVREEGLSRGRAHLVRCEQAEQHRQEALAAEHADRMSDLHENSGIVEGCEARQEILEARGSAVRDRAREGTLRLLLR